MKLLRYIIAWFRVPKGPYCYFSSRGKRKLCPYYREFWPTDDWQDHVSYCRYLDETEWDALLFDQCKICGIKKD